MSKKQIVRVQDLRAALTDALERLESKAEAQRGFVIVDHDPTGRYLQFCTKPETRELLFDEGGFRGVPKFEFDMRPMPNARAGAVVAEELIRGYAGWALSSEDMVSITEDDAEGRGRRVFRKAKEWISDLFEAPAKPAEAT